MKQHLLDKGIAKLISRKLSVFIVATVLAVSGSLNSHDWAQLAMAYFMSQGAVDVAEVMRRKDSDKKE